MLFPVFRRLAVLANVGYGGSALEMRDVQATACTLGIDVDALEIRQAEDIAPAFAALGPEAKALYMCIDSLANANIRRINGAALCLRLPTILSAREYAEADGLLHPMARATVQAVLQGEIGHNLLQGSGLPTKVLHLARSRGAGRVARQPALASLEELLRPAVIHRGGNVLAAAQLGNILLAAQSFQHNTDLLFRRILSTRPEILPP